MRSRLVQVRVVLVIAMAGVIAMKAGDIFDRTIWWLLLAPGLVGAAALATFARSWMVRLAALLAGVVVGVVTIVVLVGGNLGDAGASLGPGIQRILSTDWPSPERADLVATIALGLAITTAVSIELARRSRLHLSPLVPITLAAIGAIALSAPSGARLLWLLPLAVLAIALAALRPGTGVGLRERVLLLRGERRLLPVSLLAIGVAAGLSIPIALNDRADPRRNEPAERSSTLLDPIEATLALQAIDPAIDLHGIEIADTDTDQASPTRWRTAALENYDGRVWSPDLTLRPIGRRLAPPSDDAISASVSFLDDDLQLVPLPGAAITIDADIETDPDRTIVRLEQRPTIGDTISLTSRVAPGLSSADPGEIGFREVDERAAGFTELATAFVEAGGASPDDDLLTQLQAIESVMRDDFVLRTDASGGGLQRALIDRFLRDTQRGNAEQFSTSFVLLVRALGVDARVATGFEVTDSRLERDGDRTVVTLTSGDARIWPEVRIGDGWVAFDPVPETEDTDAVPPPPEPQVQTPAAPQPPIAPPPETDDEPVVTDDDADNAASEGLPTVVTWALAVAGAIAALLIPVLLIVALILGIKWRRRRRHLSGPPPERIRGAWAVATDRLVDAGMTIEQADTDDEIALRGVGYVTTAQREIQRLATLSSATTFGDPARPDLLAEDARTCLDQVESTMAQDRTRWQRLRWRLSLRSLRPKTASPL